jgi:hypothetical protein
MTEEPVKPNERRLSANHSRVIAFREPEYIQKWGRRREQQRAITIKAKSVHRLAEKIVRGIFYLEDRLFLEPPYTVSFYAIHDRNAAPFVTLFQKYGSIYAHEPGIVVRRAVATEDKTWSVFSIEIWSTFKMFAIVDAPEPNSPLQGTPDEAAGEKGTG